MHTLETASITLIVIAVLLFFLLGITLLVLIDHKARLPGGFNHDPLRISGMRRDHPVIAFVTTTILFSIIAALIFEMGVTLYESFFHAKESPEPTLLSRMDEERRAERLRHFHNLPAALKPTEGKKAVCHTCHGDFPHSKEPMVRTLLNMHTQFVGCMTCHNDPRKVEENNLSFEWMNYSGIEVSGPHFGTSLDPSTGALIDTDDYYSKIVAYSGGQLLEITADDPEARELAAVYAKLSDRDREGLKERFHKLVSPKGRFCSRCHTQDQAYLPFGQLGFSEQRRTELTNLNIIGLVEKYKDFYMPNLLKSKESIPAVQDLTGRTSTPKTQTDNKKGNTPWWDTTDDTAQPDAGR